MSFFINFHEDIIWKQFKNGAVLRDMLYRELRLIGVKIDKLNQFDKDECLTKLDHAIQRQRTDFHVDLYQRVNP